jgi:hypothetical protein
MYPKYNNNMITKHIKNKEYLRACNKTTFKFTSLFLKNNCSFLIFHSSILIYWIFVMEYDDLILLSHISNSTTLPFLQPVKSCTKTVKSIHWLYCKAHLNIVHSTQLLLIFSRIKNCLIKKNNPLKKTNTILCLSEYQLWTAYLWFLHYIWEKEKKNPALWKHSL